MNKLVKIVGGSLAVLAVGVGIAVAAAVFLSEQKMERIVDVEATPVMARYSSVQAFRNMMRTGKRVDGSSIGVMPFENFKAMDDTELDALFTFLKTLPPKASGSR